MHQNEIRWLNCLLISFTLFGLIAAAAIIHS